MKPTIITKNEWYIHNIKLSNLGVTTNRIVITALTGSNMYGTNTPTSDRDYIGVFIPTKEEVLLNDVRHHIPYKENNVDLQLWSIHFFLNALCKGDPLAIDLLHSPYNNWLIYNPWIWNTFIRNKTKFYTKTMSRFVDFAKNQATVYGIKGSRMKELEIVVDFLKKLNPNDKLYDHWDNLPTGKFIHRFLTHPLRMYEVCNKKYQETVKISYILSALEKRLTAYGKRAIMAKNNEGVDWKALSHAIRSAEQAYWILKYGFYSYPLKNHIFIKKVKLGEINFEMAQAVLEDYISEIERLTQESTLPETVDRKVWDKWLMDILQAYLI